MIRLAPALILALSAAGCAQLPVLDQLRPGGTEAAPEAEEDIGAPAPLPEAARPPVGVTTSPDVLDTVSDADKDAARAAAEATTGGPLGEVTVALGDPVDPGLWVKSALVDSEQPGTVRTGDGDAIAVTLRPIGSGDGGAQISLSALQALGLPLTGLHPVTLTAG
ncbi:hypothetical protein JANAI62_29800 [Jannaschia pagri]|uniref:D-galactarate dehydratase n=1 Tax=Jannaschia pagri TaxID=2829797 RepID=A0ABQ4NQJ7_9RHOB|nr:MULTISPECIES: hypothetical protein [unclassified Jannaschia]GIT92522.1 hypothetical protein JANAI61_29800 [Jannaschia sp. AI_61]GIT96357.1 hypothetical protein JANAI62_29800 [Jannaschia sp. AI_62]